MERNKHIIDLLECHNGIKVERPLVAWYDSFGILHTHYVIVDRKGSSKVQFVFGENDDDFDTVEYNSIYSIHGKIVGNRVELTNNQNENVNIEKVFAEAGELITKLIENHGWAGKDGRKLSVGKPVWFDDIQQFFKTSYKVTNGKFEVVSGAEHTTRMGYENGKLDCAQSKMSCTRCSLMNSICLWWECLGISDEDKVKIKMIYDEFTKHLKYRSENIPKKWMN